MIGSIRAVCVSMMVVALGACSPPLAPPAPTSGGPASASGGSPPTTVPAAKPATGSALDQAYAKLYPAAKQEGKLVLYGVGNADLYEPIHTAFVNRFPGIEVQGVDQRGRESREKVVAEQQSHTIVGDVVISGTDTQAELVSLGFTEAYTPAELDSAIPGLVPPGGVLTPRTLTIFTIAVNTNLVPPDQEPKTWLDVLDPKWRGKLAMDDPRGSGPGGTILSGVEALYGLDIDQKLADQKPFFAPQAGPIFTALNRGEYAIFLSSGHPDVIANRRAGAPVKQIKPTDGVGVTPIGQSLIKGAPHPNAARLWIEWSLSEEGQTLLAQQGYAVVRQGVRSTEPEASLEGVKFLPRDDDVTKFQLIPERTKRWEAVFFKTN